VSILLLDSNNAVVKEIKHNEQMQSGNHLQKVNVSSLPKSLYRIYYWIEQDNGNFFLMAMY